MNTESSGRKLILLLTSPPPPFPARFAIGDEFDIVVDVIAENVSQIELSLTFDPSVLREVSGNPNPWSFTGGSFSRAVNWRLRAQAKTTETRIAVSGRADHLSHPAEFTVEVTE